MALLQHQSPLHNEQTLLATTDRLLCSFCTDPQCLPAPPGLSSGSTNVSVPVSADERLLLPGPCLKPFLPLLISALCATSWPHPPTHIKATPAFLLILSFRNVF